MSELNQNRLDSLVSIAKGVFGICPLVGPLLSEAIGFAIPDQRLDRVSLFLKHLEGEVLRFDERLTNFEKNARNSEGLDIMEEGLAQAVRAATNDRQKYLARMIGRSLSADDLKYEETKKLLNLLKDLTDPELIWLKFYSLNPVLGEGPHRDLVRQYPNILNPISREMRAPREQLDRAALQDSYKNTLARYGLISPRGNSYQITTLGRLLIRYIEDIERGKHDGQT